MKKMFLSLAALSMMAMSCGDGKDVESTDAQEVIDQTTETTVEYSTVKEGSKVHWHATKLVVGEHMGYFSLSNGSAKATDGKLTNGSFTVDISTLTNTDIEDAEKKGQLEGHLKSADFFNAEKYPTAKFEITKVEAAEGDYNTTISGNLMLKDSTRNVTFDANVEATDEMVSIKSEKFNIDRTQWGIHYGAEGTPDLVKDNVISNAVGITIDVTLTK